MSQMGFEEATTSIHGGTDEAHKRLDLFLSQPDKVATFSKPKTAPTSLEPSTTMLSPYMKFGCIGVREIWWGCKEVIKNWKGKGETKEPENMFGQVSHSHEVLEDELMRSWNLGICMLLPSMEHRTLRGSGGTRPVGMLIISSLAEADNRFIDWGLQNQYDEEGKEIRPRPRGDEEDEERFAAWREGRTGFPYVPRTCLSPLVLTFKMDRRMYATTQT
jgi:cryptochrome